MRTRRSEFRKLTSPSRTSCASLSKTRCTESPCESRTLTHIPMSRYKQEPIDLTGISTYPLASRPSKVTAADFANPAAGDLTLKVFLNSLPNILAARELREIAALIREARSKDRAIIFGLRGHVIKTGLAPILIDLMKRGY